MFISILNCITKNKIKRHRFVLRCGNNVTLYSIFCKEEISIRAVY